LRKATQAASSVADRLAERTDRGPIGASSTLARVRHLRTVFLFTPYCSASSATEAFDRCIAFLTACVVVAQLCRTCPIGRPSMMDLRLSRFHHSMGRNT